MIPASQIRMFASQMHFQMLEKIVILPRRKWNQHSNSTGQSGINQGLATARNESSTL